MTGSRIFFAAMLMLAIVLTGALVADALKPQSAPMSEAAAAGMALWRSNGCEGCHSLYGQGGAFAPDLTHVFALRGEDYLREFMVNPGAFHPGQRVMPRLNLTRGEIDNLVAFLRYSDESTDWFENMQVVGTGGISVALLPAQTSGGSTVDPTIAQGRQLFGAHCASCHSLEKDIVLTGPSLWGIADRAWYRIPAVSPEEYIRESVLNPSDYIVEGFPDVMAKNLGASLSSTELDSLIAFLMTLEESSNE